MKVLILGSKEYPFGSIGDSGGMEIYVENLVKHIKKKEKIILITRKNGKSHESGNPEIYRVPYAKGFYLKTPSFIIKSFLKSLKLNFDVIITHGEIANLFGLFLSKIKRKPLIMVSHGLPSEQPQYNHLIKFLFKIIERVTYPLASKSITHSPHQLSKITKNFEIIKPGFDRTKLKNISKKDQIKLKMALGINKEKVIIYTGRLIKVKGLEYLFHALKDLKLSYTCIIIGDGPHKEYYQSLTNKLKIKVKFLGYKKEINKYLSISDVFVLPSLSESLNYSMIEAAYMKIPIIVTDLNIIPKNSALIVPKEDSESIKEALVNILTNKSLRNKITKNAKEFTKQFDWNKAANKYIKIIRNLK